MTDEKEIREKCGRAPATVVGGMRVSRKEKRLSENETVDQKEEEIDLDKNEENNALKQTNNILSSTGLAGETKRDFPENAVRAFHDKPHATHEVPIPTQTHNFRQKTQLFQPRKHN